MRFLKIIVVAALVSGLSGCSFIGNDKAWPSLSGKAWRDDQPPPPATGKTAAQKAPPAAPADIAAARAKLERLTKELAARHDALVAQATAVNSAVAGFEKFTGTAEIRAEKWRGAQLALSRLSAQAMRLDDLEQALAAFAGKTAAFGPPLADQAAVLRQRAQAEQTRVQALIAAIQKRLGEHPPG